MTRAQMARQIAYYRQLRFDRRRILYELKRRLGARWNRNVIAFIDAVLAGGQLPRSRASTDKRQAVLAALEKKFEVKKRGQRWLRTERFAALEPASARAKALEKAVRRFGFGAPVVRGDVGMWSRQSRYQKVRGLELYASVTLFERRKPYRVELDFRFA